MADLRNRLITEFVTIGDQKSTQILNRFRKEIAATTLDTDKGRATAEKWAKSYAEISRVNSIGVISDQLQFAIRNGADWNEELLKVKATLTDIGASESEIQRVAQAAQNVRNAQLAEASAAARGGTGGGNRLATFGRELRINTPAIPIGGFSSEQGARAIEVFGKVSNSFGQMSGNAKLLATSAGAAAAGLVVLVAALSNLNESYAKQTRALIGSQEEVQRLRLTGSKEEIDAAIKQKQSEIELANARIEENKRVLNGLQEQAGPVGSALADVFNIAGVQELRKSTQDLEQEVQTASLAESRLAGLRNDTAVATRLAAEAERGIQEEVTKIRVRAAKNQIEAERFAIDATQKEFDERKLFLQQEIYILERAQGFLQDAGQAIPADMVERLADAKSQLTAMTDELEQYTIAHDKAREAVQRRLDLAAAEKQFEEDRTKLEMDGAQKRADITQKYTDRLVDLATQAADAATDALRKLEQKRADLETGLTRDLADEETKRGQKQLDLLIDFQRDEVKLKEDHAAKLKEILSKSDLAQQTAIQARDAIALDAAQTSGKQQADEEQASFQKEQRQRNRHFSEQLADLDTQFARERQQRQLKYQRDLADAQTAYDRQSEQDAINQQRKERDLAIQQQRERDQLQRTESQKLALLNKTHIAELTLISKSAQARAAIEQQLIDQLVVKAKAALGQINNYNTSGQVTKYGPIRTLASGGFLAAGHSAIVNELRTELFQSGGRTIPLPQGMGLFTPAQSGRVLPNGGGVNLNLNINGVSQSTVEATSRAQVLQIVNDVFDEQGVA